VDSKCPGFLEHFRPSVEVYFVTLAAESLRLTANLKKRIVNPFHMNLLAAATLSIIASLVLMAVPATALGQPSNIDASSLQKKASEAQARIQINKDDRDQLMIAVKTNEVLLAKEVLLRNGFTAEDLGNSKIILRTGAGKGGEDGIEIAATCCDPKEIVIQRTLPYFTK
jgi:hypothetical protein